MGNPKSFIAAASSLVTTSVLLALVCRYPIHVWFHSNHVAHESVNLYEIIVHRLDPVVKRGYYVLEPIHAARNRSQDEFERDENECSSGYRPCYWKSYLCYE